MLFYFLLYSKVSQLYMSSLFSCVGHYRVFSRVSCVIQQVLLLVYFMYSSVYMSIPISHFIPLLPHFPPGNHKFVFYIGDSISVL